MKTLIFVLLAFAAAASLIAAGSYMTGYFAAGNSNRPVNVPAANVSKTPDGDLSIKITIPNNKTSEKGGNKTEINNPANVTKNGSTITVDPPRGRRHSSGGGSGSETPPEPQEFTFTVYIDAKQNVRSAEFGISFPEGTQVLEESAGSFLSSDGTVVKGPFTSESGTYVLVGFLRDSEYGLNGSGELGSVTFFGYPESTKLVHAKVIGENVNGSINVLESVIEGETIYIE
ncbi:MAG: hypothetical protein J7K54_03880 [Candidatus Aenigmarchaeota archaeon]|nr:hypothetical protein [Candidatus Aenigmarchaeota archaeon]